MVKLNVNTAWLRLAWDYISQHIIRFSVDVCVGLGDKVVFTLTKELLERREKDAVDINPRQVVEDFRVTVTVNINKYFYS